MALASNVYGRVGEDIWTMTKADASGSFSRLADRLNGVRFELPGVGLLFGVHYFFYLYGELCATSRSWNKAGDFFALALSRFRIPIRKCCTPLR